LIPILAKERRKLATTPVISKSLPATATILLLILKRNTTPETLRPFGQLTTHPTLDSPIESKSIHEGITNGRLITGLEPSMNSVQIEQKSYEMPPREGISIAHFLTVADVERSARYYEKVFGARILTMGDGNAPPYLQLANIWMILNVGGGPTPDKPTVTLSVPDPNHINSFMNFRVADIQACYELWKSRGAEFITPPIPKYGEIRCYIRDPDGYIIEVGQSTDLTYS